MTELLAFLENHYVSLYILGLVAALNTTVTK